MLPVSSTCVNGTETTIFGEPALHDCSNYVCKVAKEGENVIISGAGLPISISSKKRRN